jgi:HK97 gp10 family phage protein
MEISGDRELKRKIEQLKGRARAALLDAAEAGAGIIKRAAEPNAPGPHIEIGNEKVKGGVAEVEIGPDREHWYYRFFEFGAGQHEIKGSPLVFEGNSGTVVTGKVSHPGMAAEPFLRPAADKNEDEVRDEAGKVFRREIDRIVGGG